MVHEAISHSVGIRLENLKPEVRSYVQKLRASLQVVYDKYEVSNRDELAAKVRLGTVKQEDIDKAIELMQVINDCGRKNEMVGRESQRPDEVRLEDVPRFSRLPPEAVFIDKINGYKFDWIWKDGFHEGRDIDDFKLTDKDLQEIGVDDPKKRQELLQEYVRSKESNETEPLAKIFEINEILAKKMNEGPYHPDYLTNKEVLEALNETDYRPATLEESLAFGQQFWKPDADPKTLTDEEKIVQHVNASDINILGSIFAMSVRDLGFPCLRWTITRRLIACGINSVWRSGSQFLVVRKSPGR